MTTATIDLTTQLQTQEARIVAAEQSYVEVGEALGIINKEKLYTALGYPSFEEYGKQVWDYDRGYMYRLIKAADIAANVRTPEGIVPARESHARLLSPIADYAQRDVWLEVVAREPNLARHTAQLIQQVVEEKTKVKVGKKQKPKSEATAPVEGTGKREMISIPAAGTGPVSATPRFTTQDFGFDYSVHFTAKKVTKAAIADMSAFSEVTIRDKTVQKHVTDEWLILDIDGKLAEVFDAIESFATTHKVEEMALAVNKK